MDFRMHGATIKILIILRKFPNFIEHCIVSGKKLKQITLTLLMAVFTNVIVFIHIAFIYLRIKPMECMQCQ
jgi:predicted histidine transporter YuiF (NhaC family)